MMPATSIPTAKIARAAQLLGFTVVAVALAVVSWRTASLNLPGVGQFAGIIGSGFLGGIINPLLKIQTVETVEEKAAAALGAKSDLMWEAAVVIGAAAIVVAALALAINGDRHMNAAAVLTALATAFGALFIDTSKILHTPGVDSGASQ